MCKEVDNSWSNCEAQKVTCLNQNNVDDEYWIPGNFSAGSPAGQGFLIKCRQYYQSDGVTLTVGHCKVKVFKIQEKKAITVGWTLDMLHPCVLKLLENSAVKCSRDSKRSGSTLIWCAPQKLTKSELLWAHCTWMLLIYYMLMQPMNYCVPLDDGDFSRVYITDFGEFNGQAIQRTGMRGLQGGLFQ